MNVSEIETFLAIVGCKSVSKASILLHISQSATSQRLISLEEKLGFSLMERGRGYTRVELTSKGKLFFPIAEEWFSLYKDMNNLSFKEIRPSLYIGAMDSINSLILTEFYIELAEGLYGEKFDLKIRTNQSDELYELMYKRTIDLAIVSKRYLYYENIDINMIFKNEFYIVMLKGNKHSEKGLLHPLDLDINNEVLVDWSEELMFWRSNLWNINSSAYINIDTPTILPFFLTDHNKWAFFPSGMLNYLKSFNKFQFFRIEEGPPVRSIYLLSHKKPNISKTKDIKLFKHCLQSYLNKCKLK